MLRARSILRDKKRGREREKGRKLLDFTDYAAIIVTKFARPIIPR